MGRHALKVRREFIGAIALASALLFTTSARAVPTLQLDIIGGYYDAATQTVFSNGPTFSLVAYGAPGSQTGAEILGQMFYISAAFVPRLDQNPSFDAGSFNIDGTSITATAANLSYGIPPGGDDNLGRHGIYQTYYHEVSFSFDATDTVTSYNVQDNAGGALFDEVGTDMFFKSWEFNVTDLSGYQLHFDLYNGDRSLFAPFSHDAESHGYNLATNTEVPAPSGLAFLGFGLLSIGLARRKRTA
jgi:hypothetical protein